MSWDRRRQIPERTTQALPVEYDGDGMSNSAHRSAGGNHRHEHARGSRWAVQRERFRIADPVPPAPDHDAVRIGTLVQAVVQRLQSRLVSEGIRNVGDRWNSIVNYPVAAHTRPGTLDGGRLTVFVENNVWLHEIRRFHQPRMEAALRGALGPRFLGIRPRLDPEGPGRYFSGKPSGDSNSGANASTSATTPGNCSRARSTN